MLLRADARALPISDGTIDCVVTSPPYWGLRDYGIARQLGLEATPQEYALALVEVFREVRRVLRGDGTLWLNLGDCYVSSPRGNSPGNYSTSSLTNPERQDGLRRSKIDKTKACRRSKRRDHAEVVASNHVAVASLAPKNLIGMPWRVAFALQADGWILRSDIVWSKTNPMPESVKDRPTRSHEYLFLFSKSERYYYDQASISEPATSRDPSGNGFRRDERLTIGQDSDEKWKNVGGQRNRRSVWTIPTEAFSEAHFATFPKKLVEPCIAAGSREGGLVLDPFVGSGTTLIVARALGRRAVGCDLSAEYLGIARRRMAREAPLRTPLAQLRLA